MRRNKNHFDAEKELEDAIEKTKDVERLYDSITRFTEASKNILHATEGKKMIDNEVVVSELKNLLQRFEVLGSHHTIVGTATRHDEVSRAWATGYSLAYRESAAYLRDTISIFSDNEERPE